MADSVQFHLERMLPEIVDLEKRGIFNAAEIKSIIRKRTNFEYAIHKKISQKSDFLRYIEYEINLDRLRRTRKARMGLDKPPKKASNGKTEVSLSDHSLVTRIHGIYSKALKKFPADVMLWMQYFDWCKATKSSKALGASYARAIQLHPTESRLWISCAKYEFEENSNIASARVFLQRAIRINQENRDLWLEYFKLEMLWIQKIQLRRNILFDGNDGSKEGVVVPELDIEDSKNSFKFDVGENPDSSHSEAFEKALIDLLIPRAVYRNGIKAIPLDLEFRKSFISILLQFKVGKDHAAFEEIYAGISTDFQTSDAYSFICQKFIHGIPMDDPSFPLSLKQTISAFEELLSANHSFEIFNSYVEFLVSTVKDVEDIYLKKYLTIVLGKVYELGSSLNILSGDYYVDWAIMNDNNVDIIEKGLQVFKNNAKLWRLKIDVSNPSHLASIYNDSLSHIHGIDSYPIWLSYLDYMISIQSNTIDTCFMESLSPLYLDGTTYEMSIIEKYLNWASTFGIDKVRQVYRSLLAIKVRQPNFYRLAISHELDSKPNNSTFICWLFDQCIQSTTCDVEFWLEYIKYKISVGDMNGACHISSKAKREVSDQDYFMSAFEELRNQIE